MKEIKNFFKSIFKNKDQATTILIVIGILLVVNFLSYQIFFRWDLTQGKDYSISKVSKRAVGKLDDVVNIKVYFSKNIPAKYLNLAQEVKDILLEYSNYSGGKVKVSFIDPSSLENGKQEMEKIGIPILQFNILKNDAFETIHGYMGMVIQYGDKQQVIPMIKQAENLEYDITLSIKKLVSKDTPILGIVSSNSSLTEQEMSYAYGKLSELYEIKSIDLAKDEKIADDINTLLIVGPKSRFSEEDLKKIDSFVVSGKPLVLLVDGVVVSRDMQVNKNDLGLEKLLENWGIKLNSDLILDVSSGRASFSQGFLNFLVEYPLWPKVIADNFNKESVIVADLESLLLPWASSISVNEKEGLKSIILAKSTDKAWAQKDSYKLNPQDTENSSGKSGQYNLAVFLSGKLKSAFSEKENDNAKIIVVGDGDFPTNMFIEQNPNNLVFFQNLIDGLSLDEDLIKIRSQRTTERPIKPIEKGNKEFLKYGNIFGLTVLVLIFGILRYFLRRRNKFIKKSE